jgi:uncharacterized protein (UPF0548 family)
MLCLSKPDRDCIRQFLSAQGSKPFSYAHMGASRERAPDGYTVDHNRIQLGEGAKLFERAKSAIRQWKMFDMPWIELCWPDTPIKTAATVAVLISHLDFWSLNACRIVYEIDEHGECERFGFAYGTLPEHGERGEERFSVEFHAVRFQRGHAKGNETRRRLPPEITCVKKSTPLEIATQLKSIPH